MKRKVIILVSFILFLFSPIVCRAQRFIPGQSFLSVNGTGWYQLGGDLTCGLCFRSGKLVMGLDYYTVLNSETYVTSVQVSDPSGGTRKKVDVSIPIMPQDILFSGGYLAYIVSNRSRSVNLLMGGTADLGVRVSRQLEENVLAKAKKYRFAFGITPELRLEMFPVSMFSISVFARPRLQFFVDKVFYPDFGFGFTYYFLP